MIIVELMAVLRSPDWETCKCEHCQFIRHIRQVDARVGMIPKEIRDGLNDLLVDQLKRFKEAKGPDAELHLLTPDEFEKQIGPVPQMLDSRMDLETEVNETIGMLHIASALRELIELGKTLSHELVQAGLKKLQESGVLATIPKTNAQLKELSQEMDVRMPAYVDRINNLVAQMATSGELSGMLVKAIAEGTAQADPRQLAVTILSSFMGPAEKPFDPEILRAKGNKIDEFHALVIEAIDADMDPKAIFEFIESNFDGPFENLEPTLGPAVKRLLHGTPEDQAVLDQIRREAGQ